ncbi:50S ribosomal protein L33 [bacterium (Candidatus Torokbacteria) CG_4_10_14_0_2_um_filter_35_8]|nr:MAG: 50S ribosomal protein L33 [bacterium (Candidatus Torokbacteria) CG_4_10_14_0_2_um_filter_35_8]
MSQENLILLSCTKCRNINYHTRRNKKTNQKKLELKKYCSTCRKHTLHKETRVRKGK